MHHHEITSIGTSITLAIIKLLTLDTIRVQEHEQERDKLQKQITFPWDSDSSTVVRGKCSQGSTPDGLLLANCSGNYDDLLKDDFKFIFMPLSLPTNIQVIDLSQYGGSKDSLIFLFLKASDFDKYPNLQRIIIKRSKQFNSKQLSVLKPYNKIIMASIFKNLTALECLEFTSSSLTDDYPITLPKNLKTLIINNNLYTSLSVQWCDKLIELDANYNNLQSVPKFHIPNSPPLTTLRMKGSPLKEMTILDIAPLCELNILELEFPPKSYYLTEAAACKCQMLKKWCKEVEIEGVEKIPCAESKTNCSEDTFNDAKALHKKCPLLKKGKELSKLFTILKYIFFSILLLLLLACLIMYIVRHFHLKEWWAAHHASMATAINVEGEVEESLQDQQSTSGSDAMILCSTDTSNGETFSPLFKDSHDDE